MRASGFWRRTLRIADRASRSALAVTVQVFNTTSVAFAGEEARVMPRSSNWRSRAAPSAWVARQPKFSTKYPDTTLWYRKLAMKRAHGTAPQARSQSDPTEARSNQSLFEPKLDRTKLDQAEAAVLRDWKHSRQKTGRPCVGRNGTVVCFPQPEQVAWVSTLV